MPSQWSLLSLKQHDKHLAHLIELHYIQGMAARAIGTKIGGLSHTQILKRLQAAEGFINGCLCALNIKLELDRECEKEFIYEIPTNRGCGIPKTGLTY